MVVEILIENLISKADEVSESVYDKTKIYFPLIAKICLLSHIIYENFVIAYHWRDMFDAIEGPIELIHALLILICFTAKSVGCVLILLRKRVTLACWITVPSTLLQMFLIIIPDISTTLAKVAILGGLVILLAESKGEAQSLFAPSPSKSSDYLKFGGRCLITLMFVNFLSLEPSFLLILQDLLGSVLMVLVILGYKTKLTVLVTIIYLNVINFYEYSWWTIPEDELYNRMYIQYKFFEGVSVTGGLLMLVLYGPGVVSLDKGKKVW